LQFISSLSPLIVSAIIHLAPEIQCSEKKEELHTWIKPRYRQSVLLFIVYGAVERGVKEK